VLPARTIVVPNCLVFKKTSLAAYCREARRKVGQAPPNGSSIQSRRKERSAADAAPAKAHPRDLGAQTTTPGSVGSPPNSRLKPARPRSLAGYCERHGRHAGPFAPAASRVGRGGRRAAVTPAPEGPRRLSRSVGRTRATGSRSRSLKRNIEAMKSTKRTPTTKDIGLLKQLHDQGQLSLAPEFQRHSVWPRAAKAYLIDSILNDRPIPLVFLQRISSAQKGRPGYSVIDGQQRLRAIFEYIEDRFALTASDKDAPFYRQKYSDLDQEYRDAIDAYDLPVQELVGYGEEDIKDIFIRMNKYVVKLAPQELRHAKGGGKFGEFVEKLGKWDYWKNNRIITPKQRKRMRAVEFAAELAILLIEGPQDKKSAVDLYYIEYRNSFGKGRWVEARLKQYMEWLSIALPDLSNLRYRSATDFYSLIGAIHDASADGDRLDRLQSQLAGERLRQFSGKTRQKNPTGEAARYVAAASRQTDNIQPRSTRIEILRDVLLRG
jgi:hypothetical protein